MADHRKRPSQFTSRTTPHQHASSEFGIRTNSVQQLTMFFNTRVVDGLFSCSKLPKPAITCLLTNWYGNFWQDVKNWSDYLQESAFHYGAKYVFTHVCEAADGVECIVHSLKNLLKSKLHSSCFHSVTDLIVYKRLTCHHRASGFLTLVALLAFRITTFFARYHSRSAL